MMANAKVRKAKPGRGVKGDPTLNVDMKRELCERIALGESAVDVFDDPRFPNLHSLWVGLDNDPEFARNYTRARELQLDAWEQQLIRIADDGKNDWMEKELRNGQFEPVLDREHVERSKLRIEARKWAMSKRAPKKYGDKVDHTVGGPDGGPIQITISPDDAKL